MSEPKNNPPEQPTSSLSERVRSLRLSDSDESDAVSGPSWLKWLPWGLCALLLLLTFAFALEAFAPIDDALLKKLAQERGIAMGGDAKSADVAKLAGLGLGDSAAATEIAFEAKGYVVPIRLIQVSPKINGTVMKLNIEEGKEVDKGFELAVIEDVEYKSDYDRQIGIRKAMRARLDKLTQFREDEISQAKAELDDAISQRDQAQQKYKRYVVLKTRSSLSPEDFETAEGTYRSMESRVRNVQLKYDLLRKGPRDAEIDNAHAEILQAEADLAKAEWRYKNTVVRAPIKGVILSKKTEEGNIVNPSAFSNGLSASLCEMADLYKLEVDLSIAERDIAKVFNGQECRIRAEAFPSRIYTGRVSRIMPMGDRGKSAVPVRAIIDFPAVDAKGQPLPLEKQGEYLRPEMGAIVTFLNRKAK